MFDALKMAPPDPILGLTEAFNADTNPDKINLSVGVYQNKDGVTPILATVKEAEKRLLKAETSKAYMPITGSPQYDQLVQQMLFGDDHSIITASRAVTAHTPGGTGALRVTGDYLKKLFPNATLWLSDPTWGNHPAVFKAAGLPTKTYPYFDAERNSLDFDNMIDAISKIPAGDVVLLHGCCHNPTGVDPSPQQWSEIADVLSRNGVLPLVDFAYQGFANSIELDACGLRTLADKLDELIICSSFSKNFGLYRERVGALTIVAADNDTAKIVASQLKVCIRTNYSNPPAHGGAIVAAILSDPELRAGWEAEVKQMRLRINDMRQLLATTLAGKGANRDFSFITQQYGMFSFTGLTKEQVATLRDKFSIYIVGSGRVNVAGITPGNIDPLCQAIVSVL